LAAIRRALFIDSSAEWRVDGLGFLLRFT
jgi:hypothetical protein